VGYRVRQDRYVAVDKVIAAQRQRREEVLSDDDKSAVRSVCDLV